MNINGAFMLEPMLKALKFIAFDGLDGMDMEGSAIDKFGTFMERSAVVTGTWSVWVEKDEPGCVLD